MVAAVSAPPIPRVPEQRFCIQGVPWKTYVLLRDAIDEPRLKMTYCEGALELMSPSNDHEQDKSILARLLELYCFLARIPLAACGSPTLRREAKERGAEPDECYRMGTVLREGEFPDIVLEVIHTNPLLDKLRVYDGFEVPEVWLLEHGKLSIYRRKARGGYRKVPRSTYVPKLDPKLLERYVDWTDQLAATEDFAARVREPGKRTRNITRRRRR